MKKAFTLIELIFIIILIGILGGLGVSSLKVDYANKDGQFLLLKIKEARYKAMGYEGADKNGTCIELTQDKIQKNENATTTPYKFRSSVTPNLSFVDNKLCFDSFGKPHKGDAYDNSSKLQLDNLLKQNLEIDVVYGRENCKVHVHSFSGYAIIVCN